MKELKGRLKNREEGKEVSKLFTMQLQPQQEAEEVVETTTKTKKKEISKDKLIKPSSQKNLILNGKTFQVQKMPKMRSKKPSFFQFDSKKYLPEAENLGKESYSTALQEQEKPSWPKHALPKLKALFSQFPLQI